MNVKVGLIGVFDMLKFKNLGLKREEAILNSSKEALPSSYKVNEIASIYHPYKQYLVIKEIIEENSDVKSFILAPDGENTKEVAPFKAGSYLSIYVDLDGHHYASRAYSISSSPKEALVNNIYKITIKRVKDGLVSNFMLDKAYVGMKLNASEPAGFLTYSKFRDSKNVIGIAGGVGITPFISMAEAIIDGQEDLNLTILYGVKNQNDILFKEKLAEFSKVSSKIKVVFVYSDEEVLGEEHGFISAEIIKKYSGENYSIFATGPRGLLDYLANELPKLNLEQKYIRLEQSPVYLSNNHDIYKIKVINRKKEPIIIEARGDKTILEALENSNISVRSKCHLGGCGFCRSRLIAGKFESTKFERLNIVDRQYYYIHPCCAYPRSDMEIEIFEY